MAKMIIEGVGAFSHHFPKLATVVTARAKGKDNAMAVAWHTSLSRNPPRYGIAIAPTRLTYQLIIESREFGINFLPFERVELVAAVGGSGGGQMDKFQRFNIATDKPAKTKVPILRDAYAAYECRLVDDRDYGDHHLLVGEVIAVHRREDAFTTDEALNLDKISPILYLGSDLYLTTSKGTMKHLDRNVYGKPVK